MDRINTLPLHNSIIVPSIGASGGLWMLWSDEIRLIEVEKSSNFIVADVEGLNGMQQCRIIGVYGDPDRVDNPVIWEVIEGFI